MTTVGLVPLRRMNVPKKKGIKSARHIAFEILEKVDLKGAYADISLENALRKNRSLTLLDKAFITELVYGTLRWRGRIDWVIEQFSQVPISEMDPRVLNLIRLGAYQLLFLDRVPPFAAVDESVKLARLYGHKGKVGFVNANLRSIERGKAKIEYPDSKKNPDLYISVVYSHPLWVVKRWVKMFGVQATMEMCSFNNRIPPLTVRTNTLKVSRQELFQELQKDGRDVSLTGFSPEGIQMRGTSDITSLPSFEKGWFQVQDEASQLISHIIAPVSGEKVLDACAAPGGKTTHLAQLMGDRGEIYAFDIHPSRLSLVKSNCKRLGIKNVKAVLQDSTLPLGSQREFHKILIDAPCSGTGVMRRKPDSKWKKKEEDIGCLKRLQLQILNTMAECLKEDGILVYSTCTLIHEENEEVIETFLRDHPGFVLDNISKVLPKRCKVFADSEGRFQSYPHRHNMDGFFAARLRRIR